MADEKFAGCHLTLDAVRKMVNEGIRIEATEPKWCSGCKKKHPPSMVNYCGSSARPGVRGAIRGWYCDRTWPR